MKLNFVVFTILLSLNLSACDSSFNSNILDKALESGEPYFSILYNKSFVKRFSLDEKKSHALSDNLQAMAVEINKVNNDYSCELHLYIDDSLDVYMPEAGRYFMEKPKSEYFFVSEYNDRDFDWNAYVWLNSMRIRFNSDMQAASTFTRTLSYTKIHRSFLPGLTVVTLNTHCEMFNEVYYPADIWIQKQDVGDYLVGNDGPGKIKHEENNYRFSIPIALIKQLKPYVEIAYRKNFDRL